MTTIPTASNRFRIRTFVAILATLTGITLPVSGYMNHYYQLATFGVERHFWMAFHDSAATLFAVAVIVHGILNRKALLQYCKGAPKQLQRVSREAVLAILVVAVFVGLFSSHAFHVQP